jgi:hypothetical protein
MRSDHEAIKVRIGEQELTHRRSMVLMLMSLVLLQRSTSPSTKMTALSRQFTGKVGADLRVGTPPIEGKPTLSLKVQSEINLTKLGGMETATANSLADSWIASAFSGGTGDPLSDELFSPISALIEITDCDATIALHEVSHTHPSTVTRRVRHALTSRLIAWYFGCEKKRSSYRHLRRGSHGPVVRPRST